MSTISVLESHRHGASSCDDGDTHNRSCSRESLGPRSLGHCLKECTDKPTTANICWHQIKSDGKIAMAMDSEPLRSAFVLISNWAEQNHYDLTVVFERQTRTANDDDPTSDNYWDYDITGEE